AVTVKLPAVPAVVGDGKPVTVSAPAAAGGTVMPDCAPLMETGRASGGVRDWLPAVVSVGVKLCTPASVFGNGELAGRAAWAAELVKCNVLVYPVAVLPLAFLAVTVKLPALPAVTGEGKPPTAKATAAAGWTVMPDCAPLI